MSIREQAEQSLFHQFKETIWQPFTQALERYALIQEGDAIAVCISGGKDSMLMAKLLQLYRQQSETAFDLVYLVMDPGYNRVNREKIESNAVLLGIPITVFESDIFAVANSMEQSPCYLCARMRRGHLYAKAKSLGCNKIALGHHFSDVIETTLLGMFYGSQLQAMLPKLHSDHFEGMQLIRPLYCVHEDDIIAWCHANQLEFIQCACRFTEAYHHSHDGIGDSKRQEIKQLIKTMKQENPGVEQSIFNSIHHVNIDTVPLYKSDGTAHFYLDK